VTSIAMVLCDGNDSATLAGSISLPTIIDGDEGNDSLNGGNGPNLFLGGDGNDKINGGKSHDILGGGRGPDRIGSNGGDTILIAGTLGGAAAPIDLFDQMLGILIDWNLHRNKAQIRPKLLIGGDNDADSLNGTSGNDWYFYDYLEDKANGKKESSENIG